MAIPSPARTAIPTLKGLHLVNRGKVRDTYDLGYNPLLDCHLLMIVATDAISIFDHVLNGTIREKGIILTLMSHFWFTWLEKCGFLTHMVAAGAEIDRYLPEHLRNDPDLQCRAMVVMKLDMCDGELIRRYVLTGTAFKEYLRNGMVYGKKLPEGMQDGDLLEEPLFTPTTKAVIGHDEPVSENMIREKYPDETRVFLESSLVLHNVAKERKILLADEKGEMGRDRNGKVRIGDERGTPDSSRFWDLIAWEASRLLATRKAPPPFDKQLVRADRIKYGIDKLDPTKKRDVQRAHAYLIPPELNELTTQVYRYILSRLTGMTVERYALSIGVKLPMPKKKRVAVVLGSESDIPYITSGMSDVKSYLADGLSEVEVHVISCHRNPAELDAFATTGCNGADVVIAAGGKAFALPGILDALLYSKGKKIPVIGVALGEGTSLEAAKLSISELPGQPVVMNEMEDEVYTGRVGFYQALERIAHGELPPGMPRTHKEAKFNIDLGVQ